MDKNSLKEPVKHGTEAFPLQVYPGFFNPQNSANSPAGFASHWHDEMEMIWIWEADGTLTVNGKPLETKPRSVFFIHPGEIHSWKAHGAAPSKTAAVVFHWRLFEWAEVSFRESFFLPLIQGKLSLPRVVVAKPGWEQELFTELGALVQETTSQKLGYKLAALGRLYTIMAKMAMAGALTPSDGHVSSRSTLKVDRIKKALQYIFDHYPEKVSTDQLATAAGLSPFHFCRLFKSVTNQTPLDYLNRFRVEKAADLLKDPDRKVLEAALDSGFTHLSYFIKTFKRYQNCTPSKYRKEQRKAA